MLKRISVGRLPMKNFHVTRHLRSKTVSPLRCHLLNRAPIRLKPKDSRGNLRHHLSRSPLGRRTPAARTRVNPAIRGHNEMIGDKVGVPRRKPSVENHFLVRLPIAIRIAEPKNVRLRNHDHPIAIHAKTRDQFEALMEDVLFVHHPVPVRIHEHADGIAGRAVVMSGIEHPTFLPSVCGQRSTPIRILGGFRHPHPPAPIPLHGDRFGNQGLGSHDARLKTGLHLKRLDGVDWPQRSARRIPQSRQIRLGTEGVHLFPLSCPSHPTKNKGANTRMLERSRRALKKSHRPMFFSLKRPNLGLQIVNRGPLRLGSPLFRGGGLGLP